MRSFLIGLIPWYAFSFALMFGVYSYSGDWPNLWFLVAAFFFGFGWGARKLL